MRFMMLLIPEGYEKATPDRMPDPKAVETMMKYNKELQCLPVGARRAPSAFGGGTGIAIRCSRSRRGLRSRCACWAG